MIEYFNQAHAGQPVLFDARGRERRASTRDIYENHWHQVSNLDRIQAARDRCRAC